MAKSTQMTLAAISLERELRIQDETILLHLVQEEDRGDVSYGGEIDPSPNPTLFLAEKAMSMDLR